MKRAAAPSVPYFSGLARLAAGPALRPPRQLFGDEAYTPGRGTAADRASRRTDREGAGPARPPAVTASSPVSSAPEPAGAPGAGPRNGAAPEGGVLRPAADATTGAVHAAASHAVADLVPLQSPPAVPRVTTHAGEREAVASAAAPTLTPPADAGAPGAAPPAAVPVRQHGAPSAGPPPLSGPSDGPVTTWDDPRLSGAVQLPALPAPALVPPPAVPQPAGVPTSTLVPPPLAEQATGPTTPAADAAPVAAAPLRPPVLLPDLAPRPVAPPPAQEPVVAVATVRRPASGGGRVVIGTIEVTVLPPPVETPKPMAPAAPPAVRARPASLLAGSPGADHLRTASRRWYGTAQS